MGILVRQSIFLQQRGGGKREDKAGVNYLFRLIRECSLRYFISVAWRTGTSKNLLSICMSDCELWKRRKRGSGMRLGNCEANKVPYIVKMLRMDRQILAPQHVRVGCDGLI